MDDYLSHNKHLAAWVLPPQRAPSIAEKATYYLSDNGPCSALAVVGLML
jgi:hypothetical protein